MTLEQIFKICQQDAGGWIIVGIIVTSLIQVSPIQLNPWSAIGSWIRKQLGITDVIDRVEKMDDKVDKLDAMNSRYRVIRAADEIRNGEELSAEHLDQLGEDINIYKAYCKAHPDYENHKGKKSMELVLAYEKKLQESQLDEVIDND